MTKKFRVYETLEEAIDLAELLTLNDFYSYKYFACLFSDGSSKAFIKVYDSSGNFVERH